MKRSCCFVFSLLFAWILWERVSNPNNRSDQWLNQTAYPSQEICARDSSRIIDARRNDYLRAGSGAGYIFNEGVGGFSVNNEKHIFMCYPDNMDPRPRS
jgi:hypothetical protein